MSALKRKASFESETARVSREIPSLWGIWRKANVDKRIDIDKREREREKGREEEGARRRKCQDRDESRFGYDGNIASVRSHLVQRAHPPSHPSATYHVFLALHYSLIHYSESPLSLSLFLSLFELLDSIRSNIEFLLVVSGSGEKKKK